MNRTHVTVMNHNHFISARPVRGHIVRDSHMLNEARSARFASESLPIPNRSSLRVARENGARSGHRPSANVLNRAAVVRTALPPAAPTFQEKLPYIEKSQGKPVEPSAAAALASQDNRARANRARIRPAAEQSRDGDFAARKPSAISAATPQPLTEARGKKLATRENTVIGKAAARDERAEKTPGPQPPSQTSSAEPDKAAASQSQSERAEQRERQREENKHWNASAKRSGKSKSFSTSRKLDRGKKNAEPSNSRNTIGGKNLRNAKRANRKDSRNPNAVKPSKRRTSAKRKRKIARSKNAANK